MTVPEFHLYLRQFRKSKLTFGRELNGAKLKSKQTTSHDIDVKTCFLLNNHIISLESLIEQVSYHLIIAAESNSKALTKALGGDDKDINSVESNQEKSLNAAIVFINSLFDYIKVLFILLFIEKTILTSPEFRSDVDKHIKSNNIHKSDWYLSLFSTLERKYFDKWIKGIIKKINNNEDTISKVVFESFKDLERKHLQFKNKYQANILKHFGTTAFNRTDSDNILRSDFCNIDIDDFFKKEGGWEMPIGSRGHTLNFRETKKEITETFKDELEFIRLLLNQIE